MKEWTQKTIVHDTIGMEINAWQENGWSLYRILNAGFGGSGRPICTIVLYREKI